MGSILGDVRAPFIVIGTACPNSFLPLDRFIPFVLAFAQQKPSVGHRRKGGGFAARATYPLQALLL